MYPTTKAPHISWYKTVWNDTLNNIKAFGNLEVQQKLVISKEWNMNYINRDLQ